MTTNSDKHRISEISKVKYDKSLFNRSVTYKELVQILVANKLVDEEEFYDQINAVGIAEFLSKD